MSSQITVSNLQDRVIDAFFVDSCLFDWLEIARNTNHLEYFTFEQLCDLQIKFFNQFIEKNRLKLVKSEQDEVLLQQKALSIASRLYPWFDWLIALVEEIHKLPIHKSQLKIKLTSR